MKKSLICNVVKLVTQRVVFFNKNYTYILLSLSL